MRISDWSSDVCSSDLVLREHIAFQQKLIVGPQRFQRLAERTADGGNFGQFLRRQIVKIFVHGITRMNLVLNAVEARHEQRCIAEVRVRHRIGEAEFHTLGLAARAVWNRSEEHTSELQSLMRISYSVFC